LPIRLAFRNLDDFLATLKVTEQRALPLVEWLDELHGDEYEKVSSAMFFLIARRRMLKNNLSKDELLTVVAAIYDVINNNDYSNVPWANDD
jgi:hypothetical protein